MLWMFQRVMFGPVTHAENEKLSDLTLRERLVFAPLLVLIFWMGVMPQPFLDRMQPSLDRTLELAAARAATALRAPPARARRGRCPARAGAGRRRDDAAARAADPAGRLVGAGRRSSR